jgi:septal ring factor EnvC (AmiA/AmiB activator)
MEITERLKEIILQETGEDINIKTRKKNTVEIRSLYCTILKQLKPHKTLQSIGETIDLNHATIIHALRMYEVYSKDNSDLKKIKEIIMSHFIKVDETQIEELTETEALQQQINTLRFNNNELKNELKKQQQTKKYNYEIIENLNNLLEETNGTMQYEIINDRLQAFYRMNKNIRL